MSDIVSGRLYTPKDADGNRTEILIRTRDDLVIVVSKGNKTLAEVLSDLTYSIATNTKNGLMSAEQVQNLEGLMNEKFISSSIVPTEPSCYWLQEVEVEEETPAIP